MKSKVITAHLEKDFEKMLDKWLAEREKRVYFVSYTYAVANVETMIKSVYSALIIYDEAAF